MVAIVENPIALLAALLGMGYGIAQWREALEKEASAITAGLEPEPRVKWIAFIVWVWSIAGFGMAVALGWI